MQKLNPGSIQMKRGKWLICMPRRGFRNPLQIFNLEFVLRYMKQNLFQLKETEEGIKIQKWIDELKDEKYEEVMIEMREFSKDKDKLIYRKMNEWSSWINYLKMQKNVKFSEDT